MTSAWVLFIEGGSRPSTREGFTCTPGAVIGTQLELEDTNEKTPAPVGYSERRSHGPRSSIFLATTSGIVIRGSALGAQIACRYVRAVS